MTELEAFALLASIPHLGAVKIRFLISHFGSACDALQATAKQLQAMPGFERVTPYWNKWEKDKSWQQDIEIAKRQGVQLIPYNSPHYPKALLQLPDHPVLLYVQGELKSRDQRSLAVVGTRQASIYGNEMAETISASLAANGYTVISGLARGIDTAAHRGALRTGRTVAVIGSGLNCIYPAENKNLAQEIGEHGALISEFPMCTPPDRQNFPQRNRIVAGLTLGTLVIEAPIKSGAMLTMERAYQYKRKLFAIPGRADSENFRGNHLLIKSGKAYLVENAEDVMGHFQDLFPTSALAPTRVQPQLVDGEEKAILNKMPAAEMNIDEISAVTALPVQQVQRILMSLVLKKVVKEFPGKIYKKIAG